MVTQPEHVRIPWKEGSKILAVDMLEKGASPYDVAKTLGDTIETIENHYAPFTKELRDRVRRIMENGEGLEKTLDTFWSKSGQAEESIN